MAGSLQDQLLKIGVIDKQKKKKVQHEQRKDGNKARQAVKSGKKADSQSLVDQQQLAKERHDKKIRDLELNKQRDAERAEKAIVAEVQQIIQQHIVETPKDADVAYNFTHKNKVKKIYVTNDQRQQLTLGQLAITAIGERHLLIPDKIAAKIEMRSSSSVIRIQPEINASDVIASDDPYADYEIPDDLMW
ncbi:hypothetical protein LCGC14_0959230 [marine sediment metagenome]|uniref:Nucleoprotein/polynucleotide-associated enzyme n=1 Tax=marine sediment metagenome TaxID=412755 RepID=A0A0F9NJM1_9ZZZZ|nr:DUF2058 domain-containing protein [Methylophaga sp.]HEC60137.1 DUF2058 domain-containing protein [Methylophaga sp.]